MKKLGPLVIKIFVEFFFKKRSQAVASSRSPQDRPWYKITPSERFFHKYYTIFVVNNKKEEIGDRIFISESLKKNDENFTFFSYVTSILFLN